MKDKSFSLQEVAISGLMMSFTQTGQHCLRDSCPIVRGLQLELFFLVVI